MLMPNEAAQREAAEDVAHEISLFAAMSEHLHSSPPGPRDRCKYQLWYILARNLMDFFDTVPEKRDRDQVLAGADSAG